MQSQSPDPSANKIVIIKIKGYSGPEREDYAVWSYVAGQAVIANGSSDDGGGVSRTTAAATIQTSEICHAFGCIGKNVSRYHAEYRAAIEALRLVEARGWQNVLIQTGLVVMPRQLSGQWDITSELQPFHRETLCLLAKTGSRVEWVEGLSGRNSLIEYYTGLAYELAQAGKVRARPLVLLKYADKESAETPLLLSSVTTTNPKPADQPTYQQLDLW